MTTKREREMNILAMQRADRTPYDTGKRSEPKVWTKSHFESDEDYGKVDFENDEGGTIATLYIEQEADGSYTLKGYANEALKIEIEVDE